MLKEACEGGYKETASLVDLAKSQHGLPEDGCGHILSTQHITQNVIGFLPLFVKSSARNSLDPELAK